jgi:ADP-heptose:LPS heptosyltransferase/glycosyltransferase involved in cell wall biosynthesis
MKLKTLLRAPLLTQSGYGVHSRQIFRALRSNPLFDVHVEPLNWGACSHISGDSEEKRQIKECIEKRVVEKHRGNNRFDLFVHVTIPNEFERCGTFNVGVTAGIETDRVSPAWLQKCNEMDLIIVPSEHSKKVFVDTVINWKNEQGQTGQLKLEKPIVVCHEGVDTSIFRYLPPDEFLAQKKIADIKFESDFNFLHVGQWGNGGFGEDRKNIANLVKYFIETFHRRKDVGLVLKVNMARNSVADYETVLSRLNTIKKNWKQEDIPPIYLLHGAFTENEMAALYNHPQIKAFVSLTHGEGFGLPLLEAAACQLPIVATNWSGHLDFLKKGTFSPIEYELRTIPAAAEWGDILVKGSRWAEVKEDDVKNRLAKMANSYSKPSEWAKELGKEVHEKFNLDVVCQGFVDAVRQHLVRQVADKVNPLEHLQSFIDTPDNFNVLYTMPMSAGDVFISTAVIDGLRKQLPEDAKIYFATKDEYAGILNGNPQVHKVIPWSDLYLNMDLTEAVFDLVLTPNVATQYTFSNWVRRGQGRLLAEEFANHCHTELGDYFIKLEGFGKDGDEPPEGLTVGESYVTFHPGSGQGKWESRRYDDWQEVIDNLKAKYPSMKIVQMGMAGDPVYRGVDVNLCGKANYQQQAAIIKGSDLHLSIDTFTMHLAAALGVPLVSIFGCSYASSTGPWVKNQKNAKYILIESKRETGCRDKACYKNRCAVNPENPPINEISSETILKACERLLPSHYTKSEKYKFTRNYGKISGYTTAYNLAGYPFVESIRSMLGFCDEVVVVDGCSTDGTYEILQKLAAEEPRIRLEQNPWDFDEPGMDGLQKTFARGFCTNEFLWQQDCDEVVHEDDYEKIRLLTKRFPKNVDVLHLPIIELWGNGEHVTGRRHAWKWRLSRNKPEICHGINVHARLTDERTGKMYAKQGMSDGCEYINVMTGEMVPHAGFWNNNFELARIHMQKEFGEGMNQVFNQFPSVYHYSWCSLENKIKNFRDKWDKQWNCLYLTQNVARFPGVESDEQVKQVAQKLYEQGGEDSDPVKYKFKLERSNPAVMKDWLASAPLNV